MKDELISLFIDDALDLDEKIVLVETVHQNREFKEDTLALLKQEIAIRSDVVNKPPVIDIQKTPRFGSFWSRSWGYLATAAATACIFLVLMFQPPAVETIPYRFVFYQPDARQVQLSGSFTGWEPIAMNRIGDSGYWDMVIPIGKGEHRFSYILNGDKAVADPSIATRETDDFGGENSILTVGV